MGGVVPGDGSSSTGHPLPLWMGAARGLGGTCGALGLAAASHTDKDREGHSGHSQYLTGGLMATDPSMTIAVPTGQYRASYILAASPLYVSRLLTVIAPSGASLTMDGSPIEGLTQIDGTNFVTRSLSMSANVLGTHLIAGDQPFGASVYGHALATSYWYPGGLELQTLP